MINVLILYAAWLPVFCLMHWLVLPRSKEGRFAAWKILLCASIATGVQALVMFGLEALFPGPYPGVATHRQEAHLDRILNLSLLLGVVALYLGIRGLFRHGFWPAIYYAGAIAGFATVPFIAWFVLSPRG